MQVSILLLVLFFTFPLGAQARICFPDYVSVINLGFTYENRSEFLPGVKKDIVTMKKMTAGFPNQRNLSDNDVQTKEDLKEAFRNAVSKAKTSGITKPDLIFNYAGHGILTSNGGFAIPLPNLPSTCISKEELKFKSQSETSGLYRGFLSKSFVKGQRDLGVVEVDSCKTSRGLSRKADCKDKEYSKLVSVVDDQSESCKKYIFTSSDFEEVSNEMNIFGFIDSCHSGALTKTPSVNMIASTQEDELAQDDGSSGGRLFHFVNDLVENYSCSISNENFDEMTFKHLLQKLPKVSIHGEGSPEIISSRGLGRRVQEDLYFQGQTPSVSESLASSPTALDCFPVSRFANAKTCGNPMKYIFKATKRIECAKGVFIERGEGIVVTNEYVEPGVKKYSAYTDKCKRFEISGEGVYSLEKLYDADSKKLDKPASGPSSDQTNQTQK